ncbi:MAG: hypothetical protein Q8L69_06575 [Gallionellaceae bacterium]|nr:hypothetical protein [Gallionellaceae bacterium]
MSVADFGEGAAFDDGDGVFEIGALGVIGDEDFVAVGELGEGGEFALAGGAGFSGGWFGLLLVLWVVFVPGYSLLVR